MKRHWPVGAEVSEAAIDGGRMLYDTLRTSNFSAEFFEPEYWRRHDAIEGTALGRGTTWFIRSGDSRFVLRHYRRGGLMAKISKDAYLWNGESETRSFAEWYLTYHLHRAGLPVPAPIAARYRRQGMFYRADLITQRIENSESLAARLARGPLSLTQWIAIGRCIRRFHDAGVHHADLNAHNILLTPGAGLSHRLRSRHAAQARLVGGHDAGAPVPLAGESRRCWRRPRVSPTRTGTRCWPVTVNPPACRRPR